MLNVKFIPRNKFARVSLEYLFGCAEFSSVDTKIIFFISELTIYKKLNRYYKRRQFHQAIVHSFIYAIDRIN